LKNQSIENYEKWEVPESGLDMDLALFPSHNMDQARSRLYTEPNRLDHPTRPINGSLVLGSYCNHVNSIHLCLIWLTMVHSRGLGRRLGGHWDGSVLATRIDLGRYAQNTT